jgi:Tfp pilus assembly protein PilO
MSVRNINIAAVSVCLIISVLAGVFAVYNIGAYRFIKEEIKEAKPAFIYLQNEKDELNEFIEKYEKDEKQFFSFLFKEENIGPFLEDVSRFARDSRVRIVNMSTKRVSEVKRKDKEKVAADKKETVKGPVLYQLPIKMNVEGTFGSIVNFLVFLETHKQLVTLSDVEIKVSEYPDLVCKYNLNIYGLGDLKGDKE